MTKLALGVSLLALSAVSASAADMAARPYTKAPAMPVAYAPSWTGFYVGINGGYGWQDDSRPVFTANDPFSANLLIGQNSSLNGQAIVPPATSWRGAFGGVQAGYNWQVNSNLLVGFEADIQGSGIRGSGSATIVANPPSLMATTTTEQNLRWFGTARARLGFIPTGNWLVYGTGGFAYGGIDERVNVGFSGAAPDGTVTVQNSNGAPCIVPTDPRAASCFVGTSSRTAIGWTAGAGTEWLISNNITFKAEYLYVRLGNGDNFNVVTQLLPQIRVPASFHTSWGTADFNAVRFGLNYKFDWAAPVVARY